MSIAALALMSHVKSTSFRSQGDLINQDDTSTPRHSYSTTFQSTVQTPRPSTVIHKPAPINLSDTKRHSEKPLLPLKLTFDQASGVRMASDPSQSESPKETGFSNRSLGGIGT